MYDRILIPVTTRSFNREIDPAFANQLKRPGSSQCQLYAFVHFWATRLPLAGHRIAKSWSRLNVKPGRTPTDANWTLASRCRCPPDWASIGSWRSIFGDQPIDSKKQLWAGRCALAAKVVATGLAASVPSCSLNYQWPFDLKCPIIIK